MKYTSHANIATFFIAISLPSMALAAAAPGAPGKVELQGDVKVEKTVVENGKTVIKLVDPKVVVPSDRLVFSTRYTNSGGGRVDDAVITNPVPAAVVITEESAAKLTVSVDSGKSWGPLSQFTVLDPAGKRRAARASDITHVRWILPTLLAGATGTVTYHAIVR